MCTVCDSKWMSFVSVLFSECRMVCFEWELNVATSIWAASNHFVPQNRKGYLNASIHQRIEILQDLNDRYFNCRTKIEFTVYQTRYMLSWALEMRAKWKREKTSGKYELMKFLKPKQRNSTQTPNDSEWKFNKQELRTGNLEIHSCVMASL